MDEKTITRGRIREDALGRAIQIAAPGEQAEDTIRRAKLFEAYLAAPLTTKED